MRGRKIGIVYNEPLAPGEVHWEASRDVLTQVEAIESALRARGYPAVRIPLTRKLESFMKRMKEDQIDIALNLCETVDEDPGLAWHAAALLELLGIAFSGSPSPALMLTTDKLVTKQLLKAKGIRTPKYLLYPGPGAFNPAALHFPVIVKPRFEDASIGIDQESIFQDAGSLQRGIAGFADRFGSLLVEEYIAGREFNVSLFGFPAARVLPAAEIDFSNFPEGLYPIVGYRAKWVEDSFEFHHTPRSFPVDLPGALLRKMEKQALACFDLFLLRDYGRVDLRVDDRETVYVLEVNANPCLSPDAGFAAACRKSGLEYAEMVNMLVDFAGNRKGQNGH